MTVVSSEEEKKYGSNLLGWEDFTIEQTQGNHGDDKESDN